MGLFDPTAPKLPFDARHGLTAKRFAEQLKGPRLCCTQARKALKGMTLAEFWRTSRRGHWMAWWLATYCDVSLRTEIVGKWDYTINPYIFTVEDSARLSTRIRAAYHWDGTRKEAK